MPIRRDPQGRFAASGHGETLGVDLAPETSGTDSPYYDPVTKAYAAMPFDDQRAWQERARARVASVPKTHAAALRRHSGDAYRDTNAFLRGRPGAKTISERYTATMDRAIAAGSDGSERTVFRGIRLPRPSDDATDESVVREHFEVGQTVSDPAYVSTSENPQCALNMSGAWHRNGVNAGVVFEIRTREGAQVPNDDWWEEAETVLPRNLPMRVEEICTDRRFTSETGLQTYSVVVVRLTTES